VGCTALTYQFSQCFYFSFVKYFMGYIQLSRRKHLTGGSIPFLLDVTFKKNIDFMQKFVLFLLDKDLITVFLKKAHLLMVIFLFHFF